MKTWPLLFVLAGCEAGITSDAQPIVSVLKQDGDCFALMAGSPIERTLGIAGTCGYRANTRLVAGIDLVEVVIDYGADVPFAVTTRAPVPHVTVTVDGVESDVPVTMSDEQRVGDRAFYIATFRAPESASANVRVAAGVNAGFSTQVPEVFTTAAPQVEVAVQECPAACSLQGAVGSVHLQLAVPGSVPQVVTVRSLIDSIEQPDPVPPITTIARNGRTENVVPIPVPAGHEGSLWTLQARVGSGPPTEVRAVLHTPTIITELTCGLSCALTSGDVVGLDIVTPGGIQPSEALVTTRLDGVPQLVDAKVTLSTRADGTAHGVIGLTAPGAGTWQIDATVAGYAAPSIVTTVQ